MRNLTILTMLAAVVLIGCESAEGQCWTPTGQCVTKTETIMQTQKVAVPYKEQIEVTKYRWEEQQVPVQVQRHYQVYQRDVWTKHTEQMVKEIHPQAAKAAKPRVQVFRRAPVRTFFRNLCGG